MLGVCCDVDIFKLTASAQYIYREVYGSTYLMQKLLLLKQLKKNKKLHMMYYKLLKIYLIMDLISDTRK